MREGFYRAAYHTPEAFDDMVMESDGMYLTGLNFIKEEAGKRESGKTDDLPVFLKTEEWLDAYFSGMPLPALPPLKTDTSTPFRSLISNLMLKIPFGESVTYKALADEAAKILGKEKMSAQAVGQAVGHNPICIMVPCHRVLGKDGALTGYGGGLENKKQLLVHEGIFFRI